LLQRNPGRHHGIARLLAVGPPRCAATDQLPPAQLPELVTQRRGPGHQQLIDLLQGFGAVLDS
jgi:hypothetical protein